MKYSGGKHAMEPFISPMLMLFNAGVFLFWFSNHVPSPILPLYILDVTGQVQLSGLVVGAYGMAQLLLRIPVGLLSDRLGDRKRLTVAGAIFASLGCLGFLLSTHPALMFTSRFLSGIGASFLVVFSVWYSSFFPPAMAHRAMGQLVFWGSLSQVAANLSSGWLAHEFGWLAPFQVGAAAAIGAAFCWMGVSERNTYQSSRMNCKDMISVIFSRHLQKISLMGALGMFATFAIIYTSLPVHAKAMGASRIDLGLLMGWNMITYSGTAFLMGSRTLAGFSTQRILQSGLCMSGISILLMPIMTSVWALYIPVGIQGMGRGLFYTALMAYALIPFSPEQKATAMGVFQAVYALGMMLGPFSAGWIAQGAGLLWVFVIAGLGNLAALPASRHLEAAH
ncbi:MAG: MFS transporter [Deltaproteobacteria bacterium]|nr:MFS transporter [Deltaproteobacteria bacterium]